MQWSLSEMLEDIFWEQRCEQTQTANRQFYVVLAEDEIVNDRTEMAGTDVDIQLLSSSQTWERKQIYLWIFF